MKLFAKHRSDYEYTLATVVPESEKWANTANHWADLLYKQRPSSGGVPSMYMPIAEAVGVPWYLPGLLHIMEADMNFTKHLHNGDPLTARTVHVPIGRPLGGDPPFSFIESGIDAITMVLSEKRLWDLDFLLPAAVLYFLERYNGFGYQGKMVDGQRLYSPYLWGHSNYHKKGKYVKDGEYNPEARTKQLGAGVIFRRLLEMLSHEDDEKADPPQEAVISAASSPAEIASFQRWANTVLVPKGYGPLAADGIFGPKTKNAFNVLFSPNNFASTTTVVTE